MKSHSVKKEFWLWAIPLMVVFVLVSLAPQFDLWNSRGAEWNGAYAINEADEPAYASYIQAIIDGKPRINTPFAGRFDTPEHPQKESLYTIQFFSTYPFAVVARVFGLDVSQTMILIAVLTAALSTLAVFWLIYLLSENAPISAVGTLFVLFGGAAVAGHGFLFSLFQGENATHYLPLLFLRRTNPAVSFSLIFFFIISVWYFFNAETNKNKLIAGLFSALSFGLTVYVYFFHWTTSLAWFGGFILVWAILRFEDFRRNILWIAGLGLGLCATMIPYLFLLANRENSMDSSQSLLLTRAPELWRTSSIISYLLIIALIFSHRKAIINLRENKYLFLLSLAIVSPFVFNQQVLSGHSLQPFHYEFFAVNYISPLAAIVFAFILLAKKLQTLTLQKTLLIFAAVVTVFGYFDILYMVSLYRTQNIWRDQLIPVSQKIKEISKNTEKPLILATDLSHSIYLTSTDLPSFTSQPVLWAPHLSMFGGVEPREDQRRFMDFLYYQNYDGEKLREGMEIKKNGTLLYGFFGGGRVLAFLTADHRPITPAEIDESVKKYDSFQRNFSYQDAAQNPFTFVITHKNDNFDFTRIDFWYQRDEGEQFGEYTLYRVKLRPRGN